MYRELIEKLTAGNQWAKVQEPCPEEEIQKAEEYVGFTFPEELKALLRETNGDHWFLLSAERIISHVRENREIFPNTLTPRNLKKKSIVLFSLRPMVAVIITVIVFLKTAKQIQRQFTFGNTNYLKFVRWQKILLI